MRVCTTYGTDVPLRSGAEMHEIRLDVFGKIPEGIGKDDIITLCGKDISNVPASFKGFVDVGDSTIGTGFRKIRSIHDFERTPDADSIVRMLSEGDQEISKGAFKASSFSDLHALYEASRRLGRKHVLLGMDEIGEVTRIRQRILGNEFTFGFHGDSTAPGQFSADEMESLGDDCMIAGVTGHPLQHSKSPAMQNAAIKAAGLNAIYLRFDSPSLENICDVIREYDLRGMNVTIPYKQEIYVLLDKTSDTCLEVGAVNTVINDNGVLKGENTDVEGIMFALRSKGEDPKGKKVLLLGAGGASRAAAYTFSKMDCKVNIAGRTGNKACDVSRAFGTGIHDGSVKDYDIIVNCTPVGLVDGEYPADLSDMHEGQTIFDMVYGRETPILEMAKRKGCRIVDGADMLVGQGAESFRLWFGKEPDVNIMRGAL